jgi:hypothetical protein
VDGWPDGAGWPDGDGWLDAVGWPDGVGEGLGVARTPAAGLLVAPTSSADPITVATPAACSRRRPVFACRADTMILLQLRGDWTHDT